MIRLRKENGETLELPGFAFVEVCDTEGDVAQVSYMDDVGRTHVFKKGDPEQLEYSRLFPNVKFVPIVEL